MAPGLREFRQASLRLAVPEGLPEEMRPHVREIVSVHSGNARKGQASALLYRVCAEADRASMTLMVQVGAFGAENALSDEQLEGWYARFGFLRIQAAPLLMARSPTPRLH